MRKSIKKMVLTGAAVRAMMSLAAPAAMADEVEAQFAPPGQTIVCNPIQWSSYWGAPYQWCNSTQYGWYISWS